MKQTFVFIPDSLDLNKSGYLNGFLECDKHCFSYYIINNELTARNENSIGICSQHQIDPSLHIHVNNKTHKVYVNNEAGTATCVLYNYNVFKQSDAELFTQSSPQISALIRYLARNNEPCNIRRSNVILMLLTYIVILLKVMNKVKCLIKYSTFLELVYNSLSTYQFVAHKLLETQRFKLDVMNIIASKLIDIILGLLIIYFVTKYEELIIVSIYSSTMRIIEGLKDVLNTLIDSPAGLKLNFALNKTLAVFFFYHISLWRAFISVINPILATTLGYFKYCGIFGISFQIAIISDLITFLTFHVYCIYVYAARFFGLQICSLTSLWRLFIGRKYNPLRERIDSFQYSSNQLFVGTLGFTILLFLLPTTCLYYAVFTTFRLVLIILDAILLKLIYIVQALPLYVVCLWMLRSSRIKGAVYFSLIKEGTTLQLYAELKNMPLWHCITSNLPPIIRPMKTTTWSLLPNMIFRGKLL